MSQSTSRMLVGTVCAGTVRLAVRGRGTDEPEPVCRATTTPPCSSSIAEPPGSRMMRGPSEVTVIVVDTGSVDPDTALADVETVRCASEVAGPEVTVAGRHPAVVPLSVALGDGSRVGVSSPGWPEWEADTEEEDAEPVDLVTVGAEFAEVGLCVGARAAPEHAPTRTAMSTAQERTPTDLPRLRCRMRTILHPSA